MHGSAFYIFYIFLRLVTETLVKNTIFRPLCHTSTTLSRVSRSQVALCQCCSQFLCSGHVSAAILSLFPACHFFGAQTQEGQDPLFLSLPTSPVCTAWLFKGTSWWLLLSTSPTEEFVALSSAYFLLCSTHQTPFQLSCYSWLFSCFVSIVLTLFLF